MSRLLVTPIVQELDARIRLVKTREADLIKGLFSDSECRPLPTDPDLTKKLRPLRDTLSDLRKKANRTDDGREEIARIQGQIREVKNGHQPRSEVSEAMEAFDTLFSDWKKTVQELNDLNELRRRLAKESEKIRRR